MVISVDARRKWFGSVEKQPEPGHNVVLTIDQQIQYVQQQFRGFPLSREDVQEALARIALHHVRSDLQDMQYTAGADQRALTDCFDGNGALIDSSP